MLCFHIFPLHRYLSGAGNHQKKSHKKWQKNLHLNNNHLLRMLDRGIDDMEAGRELPLEDAFRKITELRDARRNARI